MQLALGEIAEILGSSCEVPERVAKRYSIDSRTLAPGSLFFAIRGPRFDGHEFVRQAFERGAAAAVVGRAFWSNAPSELRPALLPVEDTLGGLGELGRAVRRKWGRTVIAVTGSTGKTTTKEMIAALLATHFSVHKSSGNLNNQFGVPLALLALEPAHDLAVVELAMSRAGEIARLAQMAEPEIGVVTNVAPVHLEFFHSVDGIAQAKRELIENLKTPAVAVLNYDDARVRRFAEDFTGRVVTFGLEAGADYRALEYRTAACSGHSRIGTRFRLKGPAIEGEFWLPLPGRHNVENALAAIAAAGLFHLGEADVSKALRCFQPLHRRSQVLALAGQITIIDDSYNSNPRSMEQMLATLAGWPGARRRIVVVGEMLELGPSSPEFHRAIGRRCAESKVDWLLAVGGNTRCLVEGAVEEGFPAERARFFSGPDEAAQFCRTLLQPEDVVLVKGSRDVHVERVVEVLEASHAFSGC